MIDPAQPPDWGRGVPRGLQEHHEGRPVGPPLPAEPVLMTDRTPGAGPSQPDAVSVGHGAGRDDLWAMASYLGAIFFWLLAPMAIYLAKRNSSIFIRSHAAQAFNLTMTATLFALSGAIISGLLALDSPTVALSIMGPVLLALWIVVVTYLIRAASSASRDDFYEIPGWLCVTALR